MLISQGIFRVKLLILQSENVDVGAARATNNLEPFPISDWRWIIY